MTKAAARLNVVQPALSMQISRLEGSFKTKLFHRTSRGVVPTDTGRTFYGLCQKILTDVDEAQRYLRDASGSVTGEITIGIMPSVANSVLADVLAQYNASYPDVTVRVMEAYSGNLLHQLQSAQLDLAIINKLSRPERVGILALFNDHLVLITRPSRGSRASSEIASYRLPDFRLVLPSPRHGMRALLDPILASKGIVLKPEIELELSRPNPRTCAARRLGDDPPSHSCQASCGPQACSLATYCRSRYPARGSCCNFANAVTGRRIVHPSVRRAS